LQQAPLALLEATHFKPSLNENSQDSLKMPFLRYRSNQTFLATVLAISVPSPGSIMQQRSALLQHSSMKLAAVINETEPCGDVTPKQAACSQCNA
jgi:hypothetical protein